MDEHAHTHPAADGSASKDRAAGHGMVVVGKDTVFFSHLPMFMSPHDYQVILEGTLSQDGTDLPKAYKDDRVGHPAATVYTFNPAAFVLPDLFPPALKRKQFKGDLFRGHFESPPEFPAEPVSIGSGVKVDVTNVVYFQKLTPHQKRPDHLEYLLFGKGEDLFLAHLIAGPPDFDHIVSVKVTGHEFSADELRRGVRVEVSGTAPAVAQRLRPGKAVSASAHVSGQQVAFKVEPGTELYFMERELAQAE